MVLVLDHLGQLAPLLLRRVHARRVVCARVHKDDRVVRGVLKILDHAGKVKAVAFAVVVPVLFHGETGVLVDRDVLPGGGGEGGG